MALNLFMINNKINFINGFKRVFLYFTICTFSFVTQSCNREVSTNFMENNSHEDSIEKMGRESPTSTNVNNGKKVALGICAGLGWCFAIVFGVLFILVISANVGQFYGPVDNIGNQIGNTAYAIYDIGKVVKPLPSSIESVADSVNKLSGNLSDLAISLRFMEEKIALLCQNTRNC